MCKHAYFGTSVLSGKFAVLIRDGFSSTVRRATQEGRESFEVAQQSCRRKDARSSGVNFPDSALGGVIKRHDGPIHSHSLPLNARYGLPFFPPAFAFFKPVNGGDVRVASSCAVAGSDFRSAPGLNAIAPWLYLCPCLCLFPGPSFLSRCFRLGT